MSLYEEYILPHLINCACGMKAVERQRQLVIPNAKGKVLEVGMGSGLNLKHYRADQIDHLWGLEPSEGMRLKAQRNLEDSAIPVEWLGLPSDSIPLEDDAADEVVLTYTLCTIEEPISALIEIRRVLKPGGLIHFLEHGLSPDENVRRWQSRINSTWKRLAGGCNLNRDIPALLNEADLKINKLEQGYIKGPKIAAYQYWGKAKNP